MGIKNIHIALITAASSVAVIFGIWGVKHEYATLGFFSFAFAAGLIIYGIMFLKKVKTL